MNVTNLIVLNKEEIKKLTDGYHIAFKARGQNFKMLMEEEESISEKIAEMVNDVIEKTWEREDQAIFEGLKSYGITKDNLRQWVNRIRHEEYVPYGGLDGTVKYDRWYIDGEYKFTIRCVSSYKSDEKKSALYQDQVLLFYF